MKMNSALDEPFDELRAGNVDTKPISVNGWDGDKIVNEDAWSFYEATTTTLGEREVTVIGRDYNDVAWIFDGSGRGVELSYGEIDDDAIETYLEGVEDGDATAFTREELENVGDLGEISVEGPMMNYWYPVDIISEDNAAEAAFILRDLPLVVVMVDDEWGIALSGGGMDLSWEICTAFVLLGMLPPVHFSDLPRESDSLSPVRQYVLRAMLRSLEVMTNWQASSIDRLVHGYGQHLNVDAVLKPVLISGREETYLARSVDLGRSDERASRVLAPTERDDLLRKLGGRREE